jgi:hypothetical protein
MKSNKPYIDSPSISRLTEQINWRKIKQSFSSKTYLHVREIIFFAHSDEVMKQCQSEFDSPNLVFQNHYSFRSALRDSTLLTSDIFILINSFASASRENFSKLLKQRTSKDLQVIIWDESPIEKLFSTIRKSLAALNQSETKNMVVEEILQSRMELDLNQKEKPSLSEEDFRELLNRELSDTDKHAPESILAKAIDIIKAVK